MALEWHWLRKQFGGGDGNAYARLLDAHGDTHDLVAREVTQNSWDAARRFAQEIKEQEPDASLPPFSLTYDFQEVSGVDKQRVLSALKIAELTSTLERIGRAKLRFEADKTILDHHSDATPLKLLYIHDFGATGLRGNPVGDGLADSDFFRAFGQIGGNDRDTGGGSFGFGKTAFIKSSRIRCVVAYSSFLPTASDKVTRRLWGFVYWPGFEGYSGVAQLGLLDQDFGPESRPAEDQLADELARDFGFTVRNATSPRDCGTSLLVIDHVLSPEHLLRSLTRYWWPAIESFRGVFDVSVRTSAGVERPKPLSDPVVKPFLRAFEIATASKAQLMEGEHRAQWRGIRGEGIPPGTMAIVRHEPRARDLNEADGHHAHIALVRDPRMVVAYQGYPGSTQSTAICGVFVASPEADYFLRRSEPGAHDRWDVRIDESYGPEAEKIARVVKSVHDRVRREVSDFQKTLRGPTRKNATQLSWVNSLFAHLFSEPPKSRDQDDLPKPKPKPKRHVAASTQRYISERTSREISFHTSGEIALIESWRVWLPETVTDPVELSLDFAVWALADGRETGADDRIPGSEWLDIPDGFGLDGSALVGILQPGIKYLLTARSGPYGQNWTVKSDLVASTPPSGQETL